MLTVVLLLSLAACAQFVCLEPLRNDWAVDRLRNGYYLRAAYGGAVTQWDIRGC